MRLASHPLLCALAVAGCYTYEPLETASPPVGETMVFQITDRGRVGLSERFGSGLLRVEGRLTSIETQHYSMDVFRVAHMDGARSTWSGERVTLDKEFVGLVQRRQLSRTRSFALAGAITSGVTALIASKSLIGVFSGDQDEEPPDDPISSLVGRLLTGRFVSGRLMWGK